MARVLYRVPEAMALLGTSRSAIYELIRSNRLRSVKQGRCRLIPDAAIADYVRLTYRPMRQRQDRSTTAYAAPVAGVSDDPYWDLYGLFDGFQECYTTGEPGVGSSRVTFHCQYMAGRRRCGR